MQRNGFLSKVTDSLSAVNDITQHAIENAALGIIAVANHASTVSEQTKPLPTHDKSTTATATTAPPTTPTPDIKDTPPPTPAAATADNTKKKKPREITPYKANVTASISLENESKKTLNTPSNYQYISSFLSRTKSAKYIDDKIDICSDMTILETDIVNELKKKETADAAAIEKLQIRKIELVKEQIIEHAARRADLFFYLLVAVHGTGVFIDENGGAEKQHGKGNQARGTAACHSFPFANFKVLKVLTPPSSGVGAADSDFLKNILKAIKNIFSGEEDTKASDLLKNTYLIEALNSTVELPDLVNSFDGHLEGRYQRTSFIKDCMKILNKCSNSEIDPAQGMNEFYDVMDDFFRSFKRKHLVDNKKTIENFKAVELAWKYECEGTFLGRNNNTHKIDTKYLNMMLKINSYLDIMPYSYYYNKIQKEILDSKIESAEKPNSAPKPTK